MKHLLKAAFAGLALALLSGCASTTPTNETSRSYVIYDIKGDSASGDALSTAIIKGVQSKTSRVRAERDIPPYPMPTEPGRFQLVQPQVTGNLAAFVGEMPRRPQCNDSILTLNAADTGMASQGESTTFFVCLMPYTEGYRLNVYSTFQMQSGGFSPQALGASLARSVVGDSSQFIPDTIDAILSELDALNADYELIEQYPSAP
ncbi:MAG: hypothetical protein LAT53_07300 [Idiomarina sp.]|nr:hypothetical protein [Idiomarina sp.]